MAAAGRFVDEADVGNFIGPDNIRRIYDDDDLGAATEDPVQLLIEEAEAEVFAAAVSTYPEENLPATPAIAKTTKGGQLLRTITLKMVRACAFQRYPEIVRADPELQIKGAERLVKDLREAKIVLHGLGVDPKNVGGDVIPDNELLDDPQQFWLGDGGTGIF